MLQAPLLLIQSKQQTVLFLHRNIYAEISAAFTSNTGVLFFTRTWKGIEKLRQSVLNNKVGGNEWLASTARQVHWHTRAILVTQTWYTRDIHVIYSWYTRDIHVTYSWYTRDIQVTYSWYTRDIQVTYPWYTRDITLLLKITDLLPNS